MTKRATTTAIVIAAVVLVMSGMVTYADQGGNAGGKAKHKISMARKLR